MSYLTRQPAEALAGIALISPLTHFSMAGLRLNVLLQKIATWGASALPLRNHDAAVLLWRLAGVGPQRHAFSDRSAKPARRGNRLSTEIVTLLKVDVVATPAGKLRYFHRTLGANKR
ncbi:hypothetical protein [Cypionkella sp.]|uniref:hypothetical protein n=1 Tax=Cypionkella sp. TaxID=2811411 RepID=UPI00262C886E|nr:hypothetical protein [Cypionkella sp.]